MHETLSLTVIIAVIGGVAASLQAPLVGLSISVWGR